MTDIIEAPQRALTSQANMPSAMLMLAVERGDDMDRIKQLMDLQDRWEANEARKAYNAAFNAFKNEEIVLLKDMTVKDGPLKGKKYASLHTVVNAVTQALASHGLSHSWKLSKDERDWLEVTCTIKHSGGHSESVAMGGPPDAGGAKNAIHVRASTVSYLERYTLKAICGMAEQEDDNNGGRGKLDTEDDAVSQPSNLGLTPARYKIIRKTAGAILELFNVDDEIGAYGEYCAITENEELDALWTVLRPHSAVRTALKRMADEERAAAEATQR